MSAVLALEQITKAYPGVTALDSVNFEVLPREVVGLVGENGAGKSTLMKLMIGLVQPDRGTINLRGKRTTLKGPADAIRNGIGMVFQEGSLIPNLSVMENLFLCHETEFRRFGFLSRRKSRQVAEQVLEKVKTRIDVETPADELRAATRQMVEIARLLWLSELYQQDNPILILDEPTTVLNDGERNTLFEVIQRLKEYASVVLISHRLQEIVEQTDRIAVLKDGRNVTEMPSATASMEQIEHLMVGHAVSTDRYREDEQAEPTEEAVLSIRKLTLKGHFQPFDLTIRKGEIVSLVGLVGSGKEEVCQCLTGLRGADSGEIYCGATKLPTGSPDAAVKAGIGHVPIDRRQDGLALAMSVSENINLLVLKRLRSAGLINPLLERRNAQTWIEECKIKTHSLSTLCGNLSGGNQQKIVMAKWLSSHVRVLILDHPTRGVDVGAKSEIYRLIRRLAKEGIGMLIMCDTLEEDIGLSNRVVIMKDGQVVREVDSSPKEKPTPADIIGAVV
jgi:ribose transport system ATP-binding protein